MTAQIAADLRAAAISDAVERINARTVLDADGCIRWVGYVGPEGYAKIRIRGDYAPRYAHRIVVEHRFGPIPAGAVVDHVCHGRSGCEGGPSCSHRRCVNPDHLEVVTNAENIARGWPATKERCKRGHAFAETGSLHHRRRRCLACHAQEERDRKIRRLARGSR